LVILLVVTIFGVKITLDCYRTKEEGRRSTDDFIKFEGVDTLPKGKFLDRLKKSKRAFRKTMKVCIVDDESKSGSILDLHKPQERIKQPKKSGATRQNRSRHFENVIVPQRWQLANKKQGLNNSDDGGESSSRWSMSSGQVFSMPPCGYANLAAIRINKAHGKHDLESVRKGMVR